MQVEWKQPRKAYWEGVCIGLVGLVLLHDAGSWPILLAILLLPGALSLLATGVGLVLWPGDPRLPQYASWGSVLSLILMPFLALAGHGLEALLFGFALVASYLCAGRVSLHLFPQYTNAPEIVPTLKAAAHIAIDEFLLAWFKLLAKPPRGDAAHRIHRELEQWESWLSKNRLRSKLHKLHQEPPQLLKVESEDKRFFGTEYRHIRFPSEYQPAEGMPGAERWASYKNNQTAHAWVLEHSGAARPWLLCIHGYRMGNPAVDFGVFSPEFFHHKLGLNLACLVLPLHGPRRKGMLSGEGYLEGEFLDFIHAELQAQWDLRRLLSWLRLVKHAPRIGCYGVSLGGYNASLLAGLDDQLSCAIAGIPVTDMAATQWRHFPAPERAMLEQAGVDEARLRNAFAGVSPLSFNPTLEPAQLGIFAGTVDSLVWPDQPLALQEHWNKSALHWYEGAHLTFSGQSSVKDCILDTLRAGQLVDAQY